MTSPTETLSRLVSKETQIDEEHSITGDSTTIPNPGEWSVIRRNQKTVPFDGKKIHLAIEKAFMAERGEDVEIDSRAQAEIEDVRTKVEQAFKEVRLPEGGVIHIEDIQDQVIVQLVKCNFSAIATRYALYRKERQHHRETQNLINSEIHSPMSVTLPDGHVEDLDWNEIEMIIIEACDGIADVQPIAVMSGVKRGIFDGIGRHLVDTALVSAARELIEKEPNYSFVAARLLLSSMRSEALGFLNLKIHGQPIHVLKPRELGEIYPLVFKESIVEGVRNGLLNPQLLDFNLDLLGPSLRVERDHSFTFLGLQTLYDRYLLHVGLTRYELPQVFFMRVAMGLALKEPDREKAAMEFYELLSSFDFVSSTPTLFNSGTVHSQLSSCYVSTVPDDLKGIYDAIGDNAMLSKWAGGLGNDWTPVRALNSQIKGTNGRSQGVVPFLKVVNDTAVAVNQGGKRKGAVCSYLETWHLDIEQFLELKKNSGDDHRRTHDMNTANWVPDLFMKRVSEDADWTLFSPNEVPDLHDLYGQAFAARFEEYERMTETGEITLYKRMPAVELWRKMLSVLYETGHPWITFKDACNVRSPQQHVGVIHSSNLCTEITLNTSRDEIAVCNLGSINLVQHIDSKGEIDHEKLRKTIRIAMNMLDNVIDINYYAVDTARNSNALHRPVGLGLMGFQDALYEKRISYASQAAVEFADESMEAISYYAIEASSDLAVKRGSYKSYKGSLWSQGILPIDSLKMLKHARDEKYFQADVSTRMDWDGLRNKVKDQGMRNSNVLAIAPTATIANIAGVVPSIEPAYENLYVKSNLSGEFTVINQHLVRDLKKRSLWQPSHSAEMKTNEGSIRHLDEIPEELKDIYRTAFEVDPRWLIEAGARRQKWIDQSQSLNLYLHPPAGKRVSGKKLDIMYRMAWELGVKTTYYLRAKSATNVEKSTVEIDGSLNAVREPNIPEDINGIANHKEGNPDSLAQNRDFNLAEPAEVPPACSIDDPDCEACQ